ncbi:MAG TPA: hypothetical protein VFX96_11900 [Pyrinomonadaceae bacterium]|nr:hypothetical protein [Pyrinomonadaceae bacterium]
MKDELKDAKRQTSIVGRERRLLSSAKRALSALSVVLCLVLAFSCAAPRARAQEVVDKMVAIVNGRELVTYSDLLWQLALQPGVPLDDPRPEDLNRALQLVIDQRLISQEAEKLPTIAPTDAEIEEELKSLMSRFASRDEFYQRLARVGLGEDSRQLLEIIRQRVAIDNYLEFRFRSFTVVTPQEVAEYYRDVYVPRRKRQSPGGVTPTLESVFAALEREIIENKVESETDEFLDEARLAAEITILE